MSFVFGMVGIVVCLYYVFSHPSSGFTGYLDIHAGVLVGGLPPCIMLLSHNLSDFGTGIQSLAQSLFQSSTRKHTSVINSLTICSAKVRSEGVGALVMERRKLTYDLLLDGVSLIVNNFTDEEIKHNLTAKINARQTRMAAASALFDNMARISPGVGMIGTLMGLIGMMSNLKEPSTIGANMAMALVATLYGLVLGNIIYAPFGKKIATQAEKTYEIDLLVLEGVLALKGKKSSIHMTNILKTYGDKATRTNADKKPPKGDA